MPVIEALFIGVEEPHDYLHIKHESAFAANVASAEEPLLFERAFDYRRWMAAGDLIPVPGPNGLTVWVTQPPDQCSNGHPWEPASGAYTQSWFGCWCDGAQARGPRPVHIEFTCKTCSGVVLVPECSDPTAKTDWAASHSH